MDPIFSGKASGERQDILAVASVFLENNEGYLHCPNFAEIIIRNPEDLSVQQIGKEGLIQVVSALPKSYPGHSILTEDIGVCMGEDDNKGGWQGKYFKIIGRAKKAGFLIVAPNFMISLDKLFRKSMLRLSNVLNVNSSSKKTDKEFNANIFSSGTTCFI